MHAHSHYEDERDFDDEIGEDDFDHEALLRAVAALRDDGRRSDSDVQDLRSRRRVEEDYEDVRPEDPIAEARRVRKEIADLMSTYERALGVQPPARRAPQPERRTRSVGRRRPGRRDDKTRKAIILMMIAELL